MFGFEAKVVRGSGRGRSLNFPTANFISENSHQVVPPKGVYFVRGKVENQVLYGMCNFGYRPTFREGDLVMEVHFFHEFNHDLYGQTIEIEFLERIRDERKFESPEALKAQLETDKQHCLEKLEVYSHE